MAGEKTTAAKGAAAAKKAEVQEAATPEAAAEGELVTTSYADEADAIWKGHGSNDKRAERLTAALLTDLEPLLNKPTPPNFIERLPAVQGKPFVSFGIKSTQVQFDRMNDVLGGAHWRALLHFSQQAQLCHATVVVGNDLEYCRLDADGNLIPYTVVDVPPHLAAALPPDALRETIRHADVVAVREGWGGWKSRTVGDTYKASETNALKRTLARFGRLPWRVGRRHADLCAGRGGTGQRVPSGAAPPAAAAACPAAPGAGARGRTAGPAPGCRPRA
jgi:hypothetical protein